MRLVSQKTLSLTLFALIATVSISTLAASKNSRKSGSSSGGSGELWVENIDDSGIHSTEGDIGAMERDRYPTIEKDGRKIYFRTLDTMDQYLGFKGKPEEAARFHAQRVPVVAQCLARSTSRSARADYDARALCKRPDLYYGNHVNYTLSRQNGYFQIDTEIGLNYKGRPENRSAVSQRMEQIIPCVESFFAQHGIRLNIKFYDSDAEPSTARRDMVVNLWDDFNRDNAINWSVLSMNQRPLDSVSTCRILSHEIGHILGLPDQYSEKAACPDRSGLLDQKDNIMSSVNNGFATEKHLYDADLETLLAPLCGR